MTEKKQKVLISDDFAIITHYLQNANTKYALPFENDALSLLNNDCHKEQRNVVAEPDIQYNLFPEIFSVPFPAPKNPKFTFIDLFAGIGGFRIAMQNLGGKCVYSSEWDAQAQKTYLANYGEVPFGDITKETTKQYIPDGFDVLCAGFPCQAFSLYHESLNP